MQGFSFRRHLLIIAVNTLLLFALAWATGLEWFLMSAGLGLYLIWLKVQQLRLLHWIHKGSEDPPVHANGIWGLIYQRLLSLRRQNHQEAKRLVSALQRVRASAEALPDAVVMLTNKGTIDWWNKAAGYLLGIQSGDRGLPLTNILRDPEFVAYSLLPKQPMQMRSPSQADTYLQVSLVNYNQGEQVLLARDITRLKQLEQMRQDFVANASHELRTPLTVFRGYVETLLDYQDDLPPAFRRPVQQMHVQTQRMNNLVNDLLVLTRLDSDIRSGEFEQVTMPRLLQSIIQDAQDLGKDKNQVLNLHIQCPDCLYGNPHELRSAFSNLVFNAVHYSGEHGVIDLIWRSAGEMLILEVKDNGIGIEARHLSRLTERFYRVDSSRATATGGTGLGLAIVKHVLQLHHAQLEIDSTLGKGSTFRCLFQRPAAKS